MRSHDRPSSAAPARQAFFIAVSFFTGAAILILEIIGTRFIAPLFGNTIYVWSSQIIVTLIALSAGYAAGGAWIDRRSDPTALFAAIGVSGVWLFAVPAVSAAVLRASAPAGPAAGSFLASAGLFAVPLFLLGTSGPQFIRLLTEDVSRVGRSAGLIYAVSTLGSVSGALLAGFVLVPHWGVRSSALVLAALLALVGFGGLLKARRTAALAGLLIAGALGFAQAFNRPASAIETRDSLYGQLQLVKDGSRLMLLINGIPNTDIDLATGESDFDYIKLVDAAFEMRPAARRTLLIGLGGGGIPLTLGKRRDVSFDAVEIDPAVAEWSREKFGYRGSGRTIVGDGRAFVLSAPDGTYDVAILDAFSSDQLPSHLLSVEFFRELKRVLRPDGVVAINFIQSAGLGDRVDGTWRSLDATLSAVFPHVRAPSFLFPQMGGVAFGHVVFLASAGPLDFDSNAPSTAPAAFQALWRRGFDREMKPDPAHPAPLITDDLNPIEEPMAKVFMAYRERLAPQRLKLLDR